MESTPEMQMAVEYVKDEGTLLAIIVPRNFSEPGVHFFTSADLSQQLAYMRHPSGKTIPPHIHNPVSREVQYTREVLVIKRGKLRVDFYDEEQVYLESRNLFAGDVILLVAGGHGFEVLEETEMIEIKQGPFAGDLDKRCFAGVGAKEIRGLR